MSHICINIQDLVFSYPNQAPAIRISNWQLKQAQQCFVHGPSGCGKTTLLNLIGGVLSPTKGKLCVVGNELTSLSAAKRDRLRAQKIGVIFQQFNLINYLSVIDNIELAVNFNPEKSAQWKERANELLDSVNLPKRLVTQRADTLSVGQQQRVAVVRSLINQPELLIADEPTSALDSGNRDQFLQLLLTISQAQQISMLFVSHDEALKENFSHRVYLPDLNEAAEKADV